MTDEKTDATEKTVPKKPDAKTLAAWADATKVINKAEEAKAKRDAIENEIGAWVAYSGKNSEIDMPDGNAYRAKKDRGGGTYSLVRVPKAQKVSL